jgi:hypothetical protein
MVWHIVWDVLIIQAMGCPLTITKLVTRHPNSRTYGAMKLHLVLLRPGRFHHIIPHSSMGKRALSWQMASTTQPMLAPPHQHTCLMCQGVPCSLPALPRGRHDPVLALTNP